MVLDVVYGSVWETGVAEETAELTVSQRYVARSLLKFPVCHVSNLFGQLHSTDSSVDGSYLQWWRYSAPLAFHCDFALPRIRVASVLSSAKIRQ